MRETITHLEDGYYRISVEKVELPVGSPCEILSVKRQDGQIFRIGDKVKPVGNARVFTIKSFILCDEFTCITTEEKNGYHEQQINLDVLDLQDEASWLTRKALSIQDYLDVLSEQGKHFLFADKMIKFLKEKL